MRPVLKMLPIIAISAIVATPTFAANGRKHHRYHSYDRVLPDAYAYQRGLERPVYAHGRIIGRANEQYIRDAIRSDYYQVHGY